MRDILDLESVPTDSSSEISRQNYKFVLIRQEELAGVLVYLLRMIPKRKEKNLLNGFIWVDTKTFRIQRIEGTPAKKPSWWLKDIDITLQYTDLEGLWLPTYMTSTAVVRLAGSYVLTGEAVGLRLSAPEYPRPDIHNGRGFKSCGHCLDVLESGNRFILAEAPGTSSPH